MYADRYDASKRFSPAGLAAAAGINAGLIAALLFAGPYWVPRLPDAPPLIGETIELAPLPPEPAPPPPPRARATATPRPAPPIDTTPTAAPPATGAWTAGAGPVIDFDPAGLPGGTGTGVTVDPPAPPPTLPVLVGAAPDPRFARDFQPPYPPGEQRLGNDGRVTVRVLVGADGRVREVERVAATSDAFWRATERQALSRWRFRPATRDGVAEAAWRTMTVTFVLND